MGSLIIIIIISIITIQVFAETSTTYFCLVRSTSRETNEIVREKFSYEIGTTPSEVNRKLKTLETIGPGKITRTLSFRCKFFFRLFIYLFKYIIE